MTKNSTLLILCFGLSFFQVRSFTVHYAGGVGAPPRRSIATEHRHHQSLAKILRLQGKRRSDDPSSSSEDSKVSEIPQLPAIGASSFDSNRPPASTLPDQNISSNDVSVPVAFVSSKFQIQYTCNVCETRNSHLVSRIAYREGVVIATCKGCDSKHMIADNLGTAGLDGDTNNIEDYFKARGMEDTVNRVSQEVFELENMLNFDSKGGYLIGDDGNPCLE